MKKRIIILSGIFFVVVILGVTLYLFFHKPVISVISRTIDSTPIEGQIEYINQDSGGINFLTYRETSFARYSNDGNFSLLSDQVLTGIIDLVWYWPQNDKALIKFVNDPETLKGVSGYKKTSNDSVYATYNISNKKLLILPEGPENSWLSNDKVVGIENNEIYALSGLEWDKTGIKTNNSGPIVSSNGVLVGDLDGETLDIYNTSTRQLVRSIKKIKVSVGQIRLFDNGDVLIIDGSEKVILAQSNGTTKTIKVSSDEQILVGKNVFIYSQKGNIFGYFAERGRVYRVNGFPKNIDFLNLFGLSSRGTVYYTGNDYTFTLMRFE